MEPDFWRNNKRAREISEELAEFKDSLGLWTNIEKEISDLKELGRLSDIDDDMTEELESKINEIDKKISKEEVKIFLSGPHDKNDALLSIHAGAGGVDAQDWAEMLLKMYLKYFENKRYKIKVVSISAAEGAGIRWVHVEVGGRYAYGYLKGEAGVHRLVRLSPFNAEHLRHTSFAKVEVLPMTRELGDIEIRPEDIKVDTYRASGPGGQYVNKTESAVRIHHLPTGIIVSSQSERSQAQNKEKAIELLKIKILQEKSEKDEKEKSRLRASSGKAEWAHQIRSYVIHPYKMVKDHRTSVTISDVERVLQGGELDEFIEAELKIINE